MTHVAALLVVCTLAGGPVAPGPTGLQNTPMRPTPGAGAVSDATSTRAPRLPKPMRADAIARVARLRINSVVAVHTVSQAVAVAPGLPFAWPREEGLGSGVVIDAAGLILTNAHVIDRANVLHIRTPDGDDIEATLIGSDPDVDLALLRASDARGLRPAPLADADRLHVGDWVVAMGNPLGLHHTVTAGIVSAKERALDDSGIEYLQTDATLSPGSSGGPLFDLAGRVVGITVGMLSQTGQNVGLNLAIPVSIVREVLPHLLSGSVAHGWTGVLTTRLSPRGAAARGLSSGGLVIIAVRKEGPAWRAGLRLGDVVTGFVDAPNVELSHFYAYIRSGSPGTIVRMTVWRDGQRLVVPVELGRRPRPNGADGTPQPPSEEQ